MAYRGLRGEHWTYRIWSPHGGAVNDTGTALRTVPRGHLPGSAGYRRIMVALFAAGMATFVLLYDTQALLPELRTQFAVTPTQATLTLSLATGGLAVALLVAGPASERIGRTRLILGPSGRRACWPCCAHLPRRGTHSWG